MKIKKKTICSNILVVEVQKENLTENHLKLGDFGLAREFGKT